MKTQSKLLKLALSGSILATLVGSAALANDQIVHMWSSPRAQAMGGVHTTTGLYEENFFGNPARVTANPTWRVQLLGLEVETNSSAIKNVGDLGKGGDGLTAVGDTAGSNNHLRLETLMPSFYFPNLFGGKNSLALGLFSSTQMDLELRKSYQLDPAALIDVGPAISFGREFLPGERLSVGINLHPMYRLSSSQAFTLVDLIQGKSFAPKNTGGEGAGIEFDLGATYKLEADVLGFTLQPGFSVNQVLGGKFNQFKAHLAKAPNAPLKQDRTFNVGISASREELAVFKDAVFAFEVNDMGNNKNGSMFRLLHLGGETRLGLLYPRLGINQGYLCAGLGINLKLLRIDLATWGEELSLNTGGKQDRRYGLQLGIQL